MSFILPLIYAEELHLKGALQSCRWLLFGAGPVQNPNQPILRQRPRQNVERDGHIYGVTGERQRGRLQ